MVPEREHTAAMSYIRVQPRLMKVPPRVNVAAWIEKILPSSLALFSVYVAIYFSAPALLLWIGTRVRETEGNSRQPDGSQRKWTTPFDTLMLS